MARSKDLGPLPPAPAFIKGTALKEYNRIKKAFGDQMTSLDWTTLCGYCTIWAEFIACHNVAQRTKRIYTSAKGGHCIHPIHNHRLALWGKLLTYSAKLGFNPVDHKRIQTADTGGNPLDDI